MPTFPFLQLAPDLHSAVARNLEFPDWFFFSQCSKKSFDGVRSGLSKYSFVLHIDIGYRSTITLRHVHNEGFEFTFYNKRDPEILDLENPRPYRVDGLARTIDLHIIEGSGNIGCASGLSSSEMFLFITQIMKLFNAKISILRFDPVQMDCIKGLISIRALNECESIFLGSGRVTHEEMNMILEGVQAKKLFIHCKTDRGYSYNQKITAEHFFLFSGSWINKVIHQQNCKRILLSRCGFTNSDINTFIRHWLNGTDTRLEHLTHVTRKTENDEKKNESDLVEIAKGLPTIPRIPVRHDVAGYRIVYAHGFDLERSDGVLATVTVTHEKSNQFSWITSFNFIVNNPHLIAA